MVFESFSAESELEKRARLIGISLKQRKSRPEHHKPGKSNAELQKSIKTLQRHLHEERDRADYFEALLRSMEKQHFKKLLTIEKEAADEIGHLSFLLETEQNEAKKMESFYTHQIRGLEKTLIETEKKLSILYSLRKRCSKCLGDVEPRKINRNQSMPSKRAPSSGHEVSASASHNFSKKKNGECSKHKYEKGLLCRQGMPFADTKDLYATSVLKKDNDLFYHWIESESSTTIDEKERSSFEPIQSEIHVIDPPKQSSSLNGKNSMIDETENSKFNLQIKDEDYSQTKGRNVSPDASYNQRDQDKRVISIDHSSNSKTEILSEEEPIETDRSEFDLRIDNSAQFNDYYGGTSISECFSSDRDENFSDHSCPTKEKYFSDYPTVEDGLCNSDVITNVYLDKRLMNQTAFM